MLESDAKILLVDDTAFMRKNIIKYLHNHGLNDHNFKEAEHGIQALDILKEDSDFDIIICDLNMPMMDGIQLLRKIRSSEKPNIKNFKFLMLTTESEKEKIVEAIKLKVNGYVLKSAMEDKLYQELKRLLNFL